MLTPTQKLERSAQLLIDLQDERRKAQSALIAAQHAEAQAGHELREALNALKPDVDVTVSNTVKLLTAAQQYTPTSGASQPSIPTLSSLFDGLRD